MAYGIDDLGMTPDWMKDGLDSLTTEQRAARNAQRAAQAQQAAQQTAQAARMASGQAFAQASQAAPTAEAATGFAKPVGQAVSEGINDLKALPSKVVDGVKSAGGYIADKATGFAQKAAGYLQPVSVAGKALAGAGGILSGYQAYQDAEKAVDSAKDGSYVGAGLNALNSIGAGTAAAGAVTGNPLLSTVGGGYQLGRAAGSMLVNPLIDALTPASMKGNLGSVLSRLDGSVDPTSRANYGYADKFNADLNKPESTPNEIALMKVQRDNRALIEKSDPVTDISSVRMPGDQASINAKEGRAYKDANGNLVSPVKAPASQSNGIADFKPYDLNSKSGTFSTISNKDAPDWRAINKYGPAGNDISFVDWERNQNQQGQINRLLSGMGNSPADFAKNENIIKQVNAIQGVNSSNNKMQNDNADTGIKGQQLGINALTASTNSRNVDSEINHKNVMAGFEAAKYGMAQKEYDRKVKHDETFDPLNFDHLKAQTDNYISQAESARAKSAKGPSFREMPEKVMTHYLEKLDEYRKANKDGKLPNKTVDDLIAEDSPQAANYRNSIRNNQISSMSGINKDAASTMPGGINDPATRGQSIQKIQLPSAVKALAQSSPEERAKLIQRFKASGKNPANYDF